MDPVCWCISSSGELQWILHLAISYPAALSISVGSSHSQLTSPPYQSNLRSSLSQSRHSRHAGKRALTKLSVEYNSRPSPSTKLATETERHPSIDTSHPRLRRLLCRTRRFGGLVNPIAVSPTPGVQTQVRRPACRLGRVLSAGW